MRLFVDRCALNQYCALFFGSLLCSIMARILPDRSYFLAFVFFVMAAILAWVAVVREANASAVYLPDFLRRLIRWIHAQTLELFALIGLVFLYVLSLFRKKKQVSIAINRRPILMVHGYLNAGFVWDFHKNYLSKNGIGPIYSIDLGHPFQSIRSYALKIQEKAKQIAQETGSSELTLIGHSMGGVVSYYYAAKLAQAYSIPQVITIGSPLLGTRVAKIGFGQCAREMQIGSGLLKEMHDAIEWCNDVKFYNIASRTDELVIPYTSALFKSDLQRQLCFDDMGHASMLFSKRVSEQLCTWIKNSECFQPE
jgi:triacylglycerol lipase